MPSYLVRLKSGRIRRVGGTFNTDSNFTRRYGFGPFDVDTNWRPDTSRGTFTQADPGFWLWRDSEPEEKESDKALDSSAKDPTKNMGTKSQKRVREIKKESEKNKTFPSMIGKNALGLGFIGNLAKVSASSFIGLSRIFKSRISEAQTTLSQAQEAVSAVGDKANDLYKFMVFATTAYGDYKMYQSVYQKAQPDPLRNRKKSYLLSMMGRKLDFPALITVTERGKKKENESNMTALDYRIRMLEDAGANEEEIQRVRDEFDKQKNIENVVYQTDHFILQSVGRPNTEKFQVVETFGEPAIIFYDKRVRIYQFSGVLLNAENVLWRDEFFDAYERYFRGTMIAQNNYRLLLTFDEIMLEGALLNLNINQTSESPKGVSMSFQMYVEKEILLAIDKITIANSKAEQESNPN